MPDYLKSLIQIAGAALETEDRYLLGAVAANKKVYANEYGGIIRLNNEHYYQRIVARALMSSFPFVAKLEYKERHDLVLLYPNDINHWFAVVEMKRWMSTTGKKELEPIKTDLSKIKKAVQNGAEHGLMMLFSANPTGNTEQYISDLSIDLGIANLWEIYSFPSIGGKGEPIEFWVAGYQVTLASTD